MSDIFIKLMLTFGYVSSIIFIVVIVYAVAHGSKSQEVERLKNNIPLNIVSNVSLYGFRR